MRRLNMLMFLSLIAGAVQAQFINNGATVTIQAGATLRVETDFINNTGTVTNSGTLEVEGDFNNDATFTSTNPSIVRFIGTTESDVSTGGAVLRNVEMSKSGANVVLLGEPMSIAGTLNFNGDNTKIVTGTQNVVLMSSADILGVDGNEYVATTGTGSLIKTVGGNTTVNLEVGDLTNYSPISNVVTGTTYAAATLSGRVFTTGLTAKYADATDYINREWQVVATGITGYANTLTGTYVSGDAVGMQSLIKGATYRAGDWRFDGSNSAALQVVASTATSDVRLSGLNFFGKVNLKAFLAGALPSGTTMSTTLNGILPTNTPYTAAPFNAPLVTAPSIPATATDWILIEVRNATTPATVISQTSGFILNNGTIVSYDGTPLRLKNAVASGHIAVRHRNHLGIRTASALDLVNPPLLKDFSLGTGEAYTNTDPSYSNGNMRLIGSLYAMWAGNVNSNDVVSYIGGTNDKDAILSALSFNSTNSILNTYHKADINMNTTVSYIGGSNDKDAILPNIGFNSTVSRKQHL